MEANKKKGQKKKLIQVDSDGLMEEGRRDGNGCAAVFKQRASKSTSQPQCLVVDVVVVVVVVVNGASERAITQTKKRKN